MKNLFKGAVIRLVIGLVLIFATVFGISVAVALTLSDVQDHQSDIVVQPIATPQQ